MVKTYREVLQDIRPGEIWECIESDSIIRAIRYYKDEGLEMEYTTFSQSGIFYVDIDKKFRLKKDEVEFEDAVKALKEGKTIESCETSSLYKIRRRCMDDTILTSKQDSPSWLDLDCNFKTKEVLGKWCIYEEGEI